MYCLSICCCLQAFTYYHYVPTKFHVDSMSPTIEQYVLLKVVCEKKIGEFTEVPHTSFLHGLAISLPRSIYQVRVFDAPRKVMPHRRRALCSKTHTSLGPTVLGRVSSRPSHKWHEESMLEMSGRDAQFHKLQEIMVSRKKTLHDRVSGTALILDQNHTSYLTRDEEQQLGTNSILSKYLTLSQTTPSIENKRPACACLLTSTLAVELMLKGKKNRN